MGHIITTFSSPSGRKDDSLKQFWETASHRRLSPPVSSLSYRGSCSLAGGRDLFVLEEWWKVIGHSGKGGSGLVMSKGLGGPLSLEFLSCADRPILISLLHHDREKAWKGREEGEVRQKLLVLREHLKNRGESDYIWEKDGKTKYERIRMSAIFSPVKMVKLKLGRIKERKRTREKIADGGRENGGWWEKEKGRSWGMRRRSEEEKKTLMRTNSEHCRLLVAE